MSLLIAAGLEFKGGISVENVENEIPTKAEAPNEVRAARNNEVRQTPQRKPTTHNWHGNELPI